MKYLTFALAVFVGNFATGGDTKLEKEQGVFDKPIPEFRLSNGTVFRNVTLVRYEREKVVLKTSAGQTSLAYSYFPDAMRARMLSERDAALTQKSPPAQQAAAQPAATRKIAGEIFVGGGESQGVRVKFAATTVTAYPLVEAQAALNTNLVPEYPPALATAETDSEGRFELEVPAGAKVMLVAKGKHRASRGGNVTDLEWRVPDDQIAGGRVMLTEKNAIVSPSMMRIQRR